MPAVEVYSDFDGTISLKDTGNILIDACLGYENRKALDDKILRNEITFLEVTTISWESITLTYDEALALVRKEAEIDPGFLAFYTYVGAQKIPFTIVSCGLDVVIREYLSWHLGQDQLAQLEILANYAHISDRTWRVTYRDDSEFTHDKSQVMRAARQRHAEKTEAQKQKQEQKGGDKKEDDIAAAAAAAAQSPPILVFCGDGISDLCAAREADVMFARRGLELEAYCREHKVPFLPFDSFAEIHVIVQGLHEGSISLDEIQKRQLAQV
ncbi:hypothetical protein DFQ26_000765 [Actinomortierella ambigua]|nr:hypothetical protein DFQ26_000765 [Actinomortierella ambigua]